MGAVEDEDAVADAKKESLDEVVVSSGVKGIGMECLRSGMIGRQLEEVESRSLRVVRQDFCTFNIDEASSSWEEGSSQLVLSISV